jgi:hypothetical protein
MSRPQIRQLENLRRQNWSLGEALDDVSTAIDNLSSAVSNDPNGSDVGPPQVGQVNVSTGPQSVTDSVGNLVPLGGGAHVTITDNSKITRAITYHLEYDTSPHFTNPQYEFLGPGRGRMLSLPNGTYYVRAYSQYAAGGPPSGPVLASQPVTITNSPFPPLLPSQASGTGAPNSGGGYGAGKTLSR